MKKIIVINIAFLLIVIFTIAFLSIRKNKEENNLLHSEIAIMVYDSDVDDYVKVNEIPKGDYMLNIEKTKCIAGGRVGNYDSVNGTVTYSLDYSDHCYIYFDKTITLASYIKNVVYKSEENQHGIEGAYYGLYHHDSEESFFNSEYSAGDGSYRYSGLYNWGMENYVCFEGDDCTDEDNLYQIISVDSNNRVKLIKYTSLEIEPEPPIEEPPIEDPDPPPEPPEELESLACRKDAYNKSQIKILNVNNYQMQKMDLSYQYAPRQWNSTKVNTWEGSTLETYLNGEYLNSLGDKVDLIDDTIWSVGGVDDITSTDNFKYKNFRDFYNVELNNSVTYKAKIGLMYVSDFGYSAIPEDWDSGLLEHGDHHIYGWLDSGLWDWTISRSSTDLELAFSIFAHYVNLNDVDNNLTSVRPTFNLKSNVKILNADAKCEDEIYCLGTKENPMIITGASDNSSSEPTIAKYWNDGFDNNYYTHPHTPNTAYGSLAELKVGYSNFTSRPYYIKTTDTEHQVCLYYNNKEFCMGANYWEGELGVDNEAAGNSTKEKLKAAMEKALGESSLSCSANANYAYCGVGGFYCAAYSYGFVSCNSDDSVCRVDNGDAYCDWL